MLEVVLTMAGRLKDRLHQGVDLSVASEAMLNVLVAGNHVRDQLNKACAEHGLTHSQYNVLRILRGARSEGHARCDVLSRMVERAPDVTRLIDRLETQGFVERVRGSADRRKSVTRITAQGLEVLERADRAVSQVEKLWSERLSQAELQQLTELCERVYGPVESCGAEIASDSCFNK